MKQLLYISFLMLFLTSCQQAAQKLRIAENIIDAQPDSALKVLREFDYQNEKSDKNKALYGILMFKALDKNYLNLAPDSLINFSIEYYKEKNDNEMLGEALFYKGRMYKYALKFENASELYNLALDNLKGSNNYSLLSKLYFDTGDIYLIQNEFEKARIEYEISEKHHYLAGNDIIALHCKIAIGKTYRSQKNYKKAYQHFWETFITCSDSLVKGTALQEIGVNFYYDNKFDSAIIYLEKSIKYPFRENSMSMRLYHLSDSYFELSKLDSALIYAEKALTFPINFYTKRECYRILANTCYLKKDFKAMADHMIQYQTMIDSIRKIDVQSKATVIKNIHQSNKKVKKKSGQISSLIILIALIIIVGIFILLKYIRRNKIISKQKMEAEHLLVNSKAEIEQNKHILRENIKELIEKNKALRNDGRKNADILMSDETIIEIYNQALQLNNYVLFTQKMNAAYNNMVCELAIQYPTINQKEMLYCCFVMLDIPQNHAMLLLETTPNGLYKIRQRVAQKLELSSTRELDSFLKSKFGE